MLTKSFHKSLLLTAFIVLFSSPSYAQDEALGFKTIKVAGNIYMLEGVNGFTGGNIGVSLGDDGVAVIDNGIASVSELLRAEIRQLTDKNVDYLINTHLHGDHTGNNAEFGADGTLIISHDNLRKALVEKGVAVVDGYQPAPADALPVVTFSDQMTLFINGDAAKILHLHTAHTDGDAVIYFDNSNVIHTGDIFFNGRFPYIDYSNGGSLDGMISALQEISTIGNSGTKIIPGHGPLASKSDLNDHIAMLISAKKAVAALLGEGKSEVDIVAADPLSEYASYSWGFISSEKMIQQIIAGVLQK